MKKSRSKFAIDIPDDELHSDQNADSPALTRRGPMASAISNNAESLRERRSIEEGIRKENDELAHQHVRLKKLGLVLELVQLDLIDSHKLIRDRNVKRELEIEDLVTSIRELGLSNPIRAERTDDGRYELIQGYRRLKAYRQLWSDTKDEHFSKIPVATVPPGDDLEVSYRKMVDENLVRKDISFAEMAELARSYARDPQTPEVSVNKAVSALFKAAPYQKRSYIRAFAELLELIGDHIQYPHLIPRNLGIDLRRALEDKNKMGMLLEALASAPTRTADEEIDVLRQFSAPQSRKDAADRIVEPKAHESMKGSRRNFTFEALEQKCRCIAMNGRLELRVDQDFSSIEPQRIEMAISAFFETLKKSKP